MSKKLYPETDIQNIANAIRNLNGSSDTYTVSQMASAIALPENAYYLKESTEANPLSITDGEELKCQSALVTFAPKQSGTGDPSPTNVRPISGWDGLNLEQGGSNLWDEEWANETKDIDTTTGALVNTTAYYFRSKNYIPVFPNTSIYNVNGMVSGNYRFFFYDKDKNYLSYISSASNATLNIPANAYYMLFRFVSESTTTYQNNISINFPSTVTDYEPFKGLTTHTATFPDTVYGGRHNFVSGKCLREYSLVTYNGTESWAAISDTPHVFYLSISTIFQNERVLICNKYKGLMNGSSSSMNNNEIRRNRNKNNLLVRDDRADTVYEFKALCADENIVVAYYSNTPVEITLTPEDIELLKGSNTVWTDGDTVQLEYWSKSNAVPLLNMLSMGTMNISNINNENNENEVEEIPVEESEESLEEIENIDNSENE